MNNSKILLLAFLLVLILFACAEEKKVKNEVICGVKIYEHKGNLDTLFNKWDDLGINTVFASESLLSNDEFKEKAKQNLINTFVILPIFYAPDDLKIDSTLYSITQYGKHAEKEWVKFICPSAEEYKTNKINSIVEFVRMQNPTGISIDFIRHFAYWEKIYPDAQYDSIPNTCFDKRCVTKYLSEAGLKLPADVNTELEIYNWIKQNNYDKWIVWKDKLITYMVRDIVTAVKKVKPDIKVNLHAVPWRQHDYNGAIKSIVGQDFKALSEYVDYISPMTYSHMVKRKPGWINSVVMDINKISSAKILPSIQVGTAYLSNEFSTWEFEQCLIEALKEPSIGVVFWNWDALNADRDKYEIVKKIFLKIDKENVSEIR